MNMKKEILLAELYPKRFCSAPQIQPVRRVFTPTLSSVGRGCELLREPQSYLLASRRLPVHSVKHLPGSAVWHDQDHLAQSCDAFLTTFEVSSDCWQSSSLKSVIHCDIGATSYQKTSIFKSYAYNHRPYAKLYSSEFFSSFAGQTRAYSSLGVDSAQSSQALLPKKKYFYRKELFANSKHVQETINHFIDYQYSFMSKWYSVNGQRLRSSEERLTDYAEDLGQRTH